MSSAEWLKSGMNERKEQRVRGRGREDEQVPCWLAFAIILLLQSKPERQDGPVGGEDGRPVRSQTDLRPVKSQKYIPQVCFVLQTLGYQGYNSNSHFKSYHENNQTLQIYAFYFVVAPKRWRTLFSSSKNWHYIAWSPAKNLRFKWIHEMEQWMYKVAGNESSAVMNLP